MNKKWKLLTAKKVFSSDWMSIEERNYELPDGKGHKTYLHFDRPDYILVVATDDQGRICVEKQYRRGVDDFVYELPAGWINKDENALDAAIRELSEETGLVGKVVWTQELYAQPGFSSMKAFVVKVDILKNTKASRDMDENIQFEMKSVDEIKKMIKNSSIKDMGFLAALSIYFQKEKN